MSAFYFQQSTVSWNYDANVFSYAAEQQILKITTFTTIYAEDGGTEQETGRVYSDSRVKEFKAMKFGRIMANINNSYLRQIVPHRSGKCGQVYMLWRTNYMAKDTPTNVDSF